MSCGKFEEWKGKKASKDPNITARYSFTWKDRLDEMVATLVDNPDKVAITITLHEDYDESENINDLVLESTIIDVENSIVYVTLSGGTAGFKYKINCHVKLNIEPLSEEKTMVLTVCEE